MIDSAADPHRLVLLPCVYCLNTEGLYLLEAHGPMVWVQCPQCATRWWLDTLCGVGRPEWVDTTAGWLL